jgi:hypothetical protein
MAASTPSIGRSTGSTRSGKLRSATGNSSPEFSSYQYVGLARTCRAARSGAWALGYPGMPIPWSRLLVGQIIAGWPVPISLAAGAMTTTTNADACSNGRCSSYVEGRRIVESFGCVDQRPCTSPETSRYQHLPAAFGVGKCSLRGRGAVSVSARRRL